MSKEIIIVRAKDYFKIFPHIRSIRTAQARFTALRQALGKQIHQYVTLGDLAKYEGLPEDEIRQCLLR